MIVATIIFVSVFGPVRVLDGVARFETPAACVAFVKSEASTHARMQAELSARLGVPVGFAARCTELRPGVPA